MLLAPGGAEHGSVFISTRDAAQMMASPVDHQNAAKRTIESGGPEWLSCQQVAEFLASLIITWNSHPFIVAGY